jgi:hypothetical protein
MMKRTTSGRRPRTTRRSPAIIALAAAALASCAYSDLGDNPPPSSVAGLRELSLPSLTFSGMAENPAGDAWGVTRGTLEVRPRQPRPSYVEGSIDAHPAVPAGPALQAFSAAFRIHGESSSGWPKKSMNLELRDDASPLASMNAHLVGMPEENDFNLHALFSDKSLMRNYLAYTLAGEVMDWAPRARFVELWGAQPSGGVATDYQGIYLLCEKIKIDKDRVAVARPGPGGPEDPATSGGYILRIDKGSGDWSVADIKTRNLTVLEPKAEELTAGQEAYLTGYFQALEACLRSTPVSDWRAYLDETSFMDFLIINELFKNVDGYRLSTYMHKDRGGKLKAGPVWDFDLSSGNDGRAMAVDEWELLSQLQPGFNDYFPPFWWCEMLHDGAFRSGLRARWRELRRSNLSDARIAALIDAAVAQVEPGLDANFARYPCLTRAGDMFWTPTPIPYVDNGHDENNYTYDDHLTSFREWMRHRIAWLDSDESWRAMDDWAASAQLHLDQGGNL